MKHVAWTDIQSFHNTRKTANLYPELLSGSSSVTYKAKIKLHGTNAGVIIDTLGNVIAMSRSTIITSKNDNLGFAAWVESHADAFKSLASPVGDMIVYGEWCGKGIQKGVAISSIPNKVFAVFSIRMMHGDGQELIVEPDQINSILKNVDIPDQTMKIIPWYNGETSEWVIDWSAESDKIQPIVDSINDEVFVVEKLDPWVKLTFNVEGTGEGLVLYPVSEHHKTYKCFSDLSFKAKGEKHKLVSKAKPAQLEPETAANFEEFANLVITEARCEQGCRAVNNGELSFDMKNVGNFLKWINNDILKETVDELQASKIDKKLSLAACNNKARKWYIDNAKKF